MILRNNGLEPITILTTSGPVTFKRTRLIPADEESKKRLLELENVKSIYPMDSALGIDRYPFKMTYRVIAAIAREGVMSNSYADAAMSYEEKYHYKVSKSQVEEITDYVGAMAFSKQCSDAELARLCLENDKRDNRRRRRRDDDILYIEFDGAMVHVRDKGKDEEKGIEGKPGWCECKNAIAFHSSNITVFVDEDGVKGHRIGTRDAIGYIGKAEEFKSHLYAMAKRNDCDRCSKVIVIADGAEWIGGLVDSLFPYAIHILDKFHAKENAGAFAKAFIIGKNKQKQFADKLCDLIDAGDVDGLLKELEPYKGLKREGVVNMYTYVDNHRDCMNYAEYEKAGYFVGSGAIESANIYLMQDRMKLPGMRWMISRAQCMLTLKTYLETSRWHEIVGMLRCYAYTGF